MKLWVGILLEQISFFRNKRILFCSGFFSELRRGFSFLFWLVLFVFFTRNKLLGFLFGVFGGFFLGFFFFSWGFPPLSAFSAMPVCSCVQWVSSLAKQLHMFRGFLLF